MIDTTRQVPNPDSKGMKSLITALAVLLAVTFGAPSAQAKDKHHKRQKHHKHYDNRDRYHSSPRIIHERSYGSRPFYYYKGTKYYSTYRDPAAGNRYYYPNPGITLHFGR